MQFCVAHFSASVQSQLSGSTEPSTCLAKMDMLGSIARVPVAAAAAAEPSGSRQGQSKFLQSEPSSQTVATVATVSRAVDRVMDLAKRQSRRTAELVVSPRPAGETVGEDEATVAALLGGRSLEVGSAEVLAVKLVASHSLLVAAAVATAPPARTVSAAKSRALPPAAAHMGLQI